MSAKTDNALQSIQNIIAFGMPHKDDMYAVQGYCDMLKKEIAELEDEVDNRREDMNTIIPQQDEEIEQLNKKLAVEHHRANVGWERALAWKATAIRAINSTLRSGTVCEFCQYNPSSCFGAPCPDVSLKNALTHFSAPEDA